MHCFCQLNFIMFFSISYIVLTVIFIIIVFDMVSTRSIFPCFFFAGFLLFSPKGSVTGCDSSLGRLHFAYASSFPLLLLRLCSNRCDEALLAYINSLLNRLSIVHGGKISTIIIIIIIIIRSSVTKFHLIVFIYVSDVFRCRFLLHL